MSDSGKGIARVTTLVLLGGLCMGNRGACNCDPPDKVGELPDCSNHPPSLSCDPVDVALHPGECVEFSNPCAEGWNGLDGFRLCDPPNGLSIRSFREPRTRSLCASQGAVQGDYSVDFFYTMPTGWGEGLMFVHVVGSGLSVTATANPSSISVGEASQLDAVVTGGVPPYSFSWFPSGSLDDPAISDPVATPTNTTDYTVTVSDSVGSVVTDRVTVTVGVAVEATASPASIVPGESSFLEAIPTGGIPPYNYIWTPGDSLDSDSIRDPIATPSTSTEYTVVIADAFGAGASDSVTVTVESLGLHADIQLIVVAPGLAVQIDASGSTPQEAITEYRFWCDYFPAYPPTYIYTTPIMMDPDYCAYDGVATHTLAVEVFNAVGDSDLATTTFDSHP